SDALTNEKQSRLTGGSTVELTKAPFIVSIRRNTTSNQFSHLCGGALITQRVVITAAHCFVNSSSVTLAYRPVKEFNVMLGSIMLMQQDLYTTILDIQKILPHEKFTVTELQNDIALVFLNGLISWSHPVIRAISLQTQETPSNTQCTVFGWGINDKQEISYYLKAAYVSISTKEECAEISTYGTYGIFCAGYSPGGVGACAGDIGDPLVCNNLLTGIVSKPNCGKLGYPDTYTNVSEFYNWIKQTNASLDYTKYGDGAAGFSQSNVLVLLSLSIVFSLSYLLKNDETLDNKSLKMLLMKILIVFILYMQQNCYAQFAQTKIINGTEVNWSGTKYQVSLRLKFNDWFFGAGHICGGTLISTKAILTAAHCMLDSNKNLRDPAVFLVVMGNLNKYQQNQNTLIYNVTNFTVHENFNDTTYEADIAILYIDREVPVNDKLVQPIALNEQSNLLHGINCIVTGWGKTETGSYASQLMGVEVEIIDRNLCSLNYGPLIREDMICAGYMNGERDACFGDSGGPLVCNNKLCGVVSFGSGCAEPGYPGVYIDVATYSIWINEKINVRPNYTAHVGETIDYETVSGVKNLLANLSLYYIIMFLVFLIE
ncbi:transmembrane protease serine 9-like, partial [Teleopsis dalmanni]|uniref:transmembrane protease serine 9-like n=1 Tax=Teleopsis dalmanni TaxID=139649 RepID=UPI0018CE53B7